MPASCPRTAAFAAASVGRGASRMSAKTASNPHAVRSRPGQPMPCFKQATRHIAQRGLLIVENFQRKPSVEFRVVQSPAFELSILIVLDEAVIGIAGKGEGLSRSVSTVGSFNSRRSGFAAFR